MTLGHVEQRKAERKPGEITGPATPFTQIGHEEGGGVEQIEPGQRAVQIIEGAGLGFAAGGSSRSGYIN